MNPERSAFSLVELLAVIAIMAILVALVVPSFRSVTDGHAVEQAGQDVSHSLMLARDLAITRNRWTELRVIKTPSDGGAETYRAIQIWQRQDDGSSIPVSRATYLPQAMAIAENATLSPSLQTNAPVRGMMTLAGANRSYLGILFRPEGVPDLRASGTNAAACLTVVAEQKRALDSLPPNFRSLFVNPVTGEVRMFRP